MIRVAPREASFLLGLSLCLTFLLSPAVAQRGGLRRVSKKQKTSAPAKTSAVPAYQPAPLAPVPLEQLPVVAPRVSFKDGELTIEAHNSTLADILKAVRQQTGAELEIPANATEHVVADIGPGPARQVLAELLNGTHFNYVMVGSSKDPNAVESIFLTPKTSGPVESTASNVSRPRQLPQPPAAVTVPEPDASDDGSDSAENSEDAPPEQSADQQNSQDPGQQTPKTPEQLLQELQRQQLQQQQQQNRGPAGQAPGILPNQPPTAAPPNPHRPE